MKFTPHSLIVLVLHGESLAPRAGPNSLTRMSWVHWQQVHRDNAAVTVVARPELGPGLSGVNVTVTRQSTEMQQEGLRVSLPVSR